MKRLGRLPSTLRIVGEGGSVVLRYADGDEAPVIVAAWPGGYAEAEPEAEVADDALCAVLVGVPANTVIPEGLYQRIAQLLCAAI